MVRTRLRRLAFIGLLILSWAAVRPEPSLACSCASNVISPLDIVFVGRVVAVVDGEWIRERLWLHHEGFGSTVALLAVERLWQGPERRFAVVIGGSAQGDCMLHFVPEARHLINAVDDEYGPLYTNTCIGSRQMDPAP